MAKLEFKEEKVIELESEKNRNSNEEDFTRSVKLEDGKNDWRHVVFDDGSILVEQWIHTNLGEWFLCPEKLDPNDKCDSCAFGWKLFNANKEAHPEYAHAKPKAKSWHTDESKKWLAQKKYAMRGIWRTKEAEDIEKYGIPKLRFLDLSETYAKVIKSYYEKSERKDWGTICDPYEGRDLAIKKDVKAAAESQASLTIDRKPKASKLFETLETNDENIDKMLEVAVDVDKRYARKTGEDVTKMMEEYSKKLRDRATQQTVGKEDKKENFEDQESSEFSDARKELADESTKAKIDDIMSKLKG